MDDETLEAAARAIAFLGEAALSTSAAKLVTRARNVAEAAEGAENADHQGESEARKEAISVLLEAADALEKVESEGRSPAVSGLLGAATELQAVLGVGLDVLGVGAADLARRCGEFREAAEGIEKVRRRAAEEELSQQNRPWWLFWRRQGHGIEDPEGGGLRHHLLDTGSMPNDLQAPRIMDAAKISVEFLSDEAARSDKLVELAEKIGLYAHNLGVPDQTLKAAREVLQKVESPNTLEDTVNGLEAAAMGVHKEANAQGVILRSPAVQLEAVCQDYLEASDAMALLQRAAKERARKRESTVQNAPPPLPCPSLGEGDQRRSGWLGYALSGSLTLAPYLMAANAPKPLETNDRLTISFVLSLWWSVVASGAVCSSYARSRLEMCYAQLAARIGIYGTNIFAIHFFYWILGSENTDARCTCLWVATVLHFFFFALACWRWDP